MDHAEATTMKAAERYTLSDLSVSEVEEFERHFFDCPQCSEELRILSMLQENARAVFIEQNSTPSSTRAAQPAVQAAAERPPKRRFSWQVAFAPAMVMLIAGVFAGYEIGEGRGGDPQSLNAYPLYAASRGAETAVSVQPGAKFFTVYMDRTWDTDFASYRAVVRDEAPTGQTGAERVSLPIPAPAQGRLIQVLFPAKSLAAGRYVLTILGKEASGAESKAADYSFTLRFE
jgi:hypothetical protein